MGALSQQPLFTSYMIISIASDFSVAPGPRYPWEGDNCGQNFRTKILVPQLHAAIEAGQILTVDLDRTAGYGTSFLEEAFGGLIREDGYSLETLKKNLKLHSKEEPELLDEISEYMKDADALAKHPS